MSASEEIALEYRARDERLDWLIPEERYEWLYVREYLFPHYEWLRTENGAAWSKATSGLRG